MQKQVQLYGITQDDIQRIFERVVKTFRNRFLWVDVSYLYNFHLDDFEEIRKFCLYTRYDFKAVLQWHEWLERWYADQTVRIANKYIKPIQISRSLDRVVNEAMEDVASFFTGGIGGDVIAPYKWHAIGSGVFTEVLPSDKAMVNQVSRIDVTTDPNGGSMSRDGSTIYIIGNHPKSIEQGDMSELGAFNSDDTANDRMLDHSLFTRAIEHHINQDVAGGTIIVWQCSS
jgi:hypothetical protein